MHNMIYINLFSFCNNPEGMYFYSHFTGKENWYFTIFYLMMDLGGRTYFYHFLHLGHVADWVDNSLQISFFWSLRLSCHQWKVSLGVLSWTSGNQQLHSYGSASSLHKLLYFCFAKNWKYIKTHGEIMDLLDNIILPCTVYIYIHVYSFIGAK